MSPVDLLPLHLGSKAQGSVRVPGSKSLSNRLLLLAAVIMMRVAVAVADLPPSLA